MPGTETAKYVSIPLSSSSSDRRGPNSRPRNNDDISPEPDPSDSLRSNWIVESKWGLGWKAISTIVGFYLLVAIVHLAIFLKLDGRLIDTEGLLSQTYLAALSTLLVNIFGTSLGISLGVALTQYLWHLFRTNPMTVATVESLFGIRGSPLFLLRWTSWVAAPVIYSMASVILLLSIAKVFPPGALTIVPRDALFNVSMSTVPTFQPDYVGNGSRDGALAHAIGVFSVISSIWTYTAVHPVLRRLAFATLSGGEVISSPSHCGTNCSYDIAFEGPYFICTETTDITLQERHFIGTDYYPIYRYYSARLNDLGLVPHSGLDYNDDVYFPSFFINQSAPIGVLSSYENQLVSKTSRLECQPGLVTYELHLEFVNGVRTLSYSRKDDVQALINLYRIYALPPSRNHSEKWTKEQLSNLKFTNIYALIDSVAEALTGIYPMYALSKVSNKTTTTLTNGTTVEYDPASKGFAPLGLRRLGPINGTIVATSYLNKNRDSLDPTAAIELDISADLLNEALANVTFSALFSLPYWSTDVQVTKWGIRNYYSFSNPINLFIPYGASLFVALPFLILGMVALRRNGVTAMDGSFLQILMTTTASKRLNMRAAGGCLGGEVNIPIDLKEERILFGELVKEDVDSLTQGSEEETVLQRAGFGLEDEVVPLRKRGRYGIDCG
ncbi:Fc.00g036410.m01.CDS01 [Cosmosporella sp. VM-42]